MDECASRDWCLHVVHGMNITEWFRVNFEYLSKDIFFHYKLIVTGTKLENQLYSVQGTVLTFQIKTNIHTHTHTHTHIYTPPPPPHKHTHTHCKK
jgi:hypothetical protein